MNINLSKWNANTALEWLWNGFWIGVGLAVSRLVLKYIPYI